MFLGLRLAITTKIVAILSGLTTENTNRVITTEDGRAIVP